MSALRLGAAVLVDTCGLRGAALTVAEAKDDGYYALRLANGNPVPGFYHVDLMKGGVGQ